MSTTTASRRIRTIAALLLTSAAVALGVTGCATGDDAGSGGAGSSGSTTANVDGTYVKVAETSGISSAWIVEGDSIQYVNGSCSQYDLDHEPAVLSEDLTRITDPKTGDNYTLAWYDDRSGFVWEDHGDFIRDDSKIGKSAVERWEATCGVEWLG